jgi:hypothetical protein
VLGQLLGSGPAPLPAPPTPPLPAPTSPDLDPDRRAIGPTGAPSSPPPDTASLPVLVAALEAEAAEPGSHGQVTALTGASGGQVVRLSGRPDGTFVEFTGVTVPEPGRYQLTVFYSSEQDRDGSVTVNGGGPAAVTFGSTGAGGISTVSLTVELAGDGNTILIGTAGGAPVSLDQITLTG